MSLFKHEIASLRELIIVRHRGAAVRVTITLADDRPRPPFTVRVDADPEIGREPAGPGGWECWTHGDGGDYGEPAFMRVAYKDDEMRSFPTFFLDGPREWDVEFSELIPHPVIVAARARRKAALEAEVEGDR